MEGESQEHASAVRAKLEFPVWHSTFTKAYSAWANAPGDLKTPLLLQGQALAKAESWLLACPDRLTESQKRFIVRSIALRARGGGELSEPVAKGQSAKRGKWHRSADRGLWTLYAVIAFGLWLFSPDIIKDVLERSLQPRESHQESRGDKVKTAGDLAKISVSALNGEADRKKAEVLPQATPLSDVGEPPLHTPTAQPPSAAVRLADLANEQIEAGKSRPAFLLAIESAEEALAQSSPDNATALRAAGLISRLMATREALGTLAPRSAVATSTMFCQGARALLAITADEALTVWARAGERIAAAELPDAQTLSGAAVDRECRRVMLPNEDFNVEVRSLSDGKVVAELKGHEGPILASSFSPDGATIVTASQDSTARLWDAQTGRLRTVLSGHDWHVVSAEFSSDGQRVVTGSSDMTARIWDVATGRKKYALVGHQGVVTSARFSSDGARVLTTSWDGSTRLWDATTGNQLLALQQPGGVLLAELSPDGRWIATSSADGSVQLWDSGTGAQAHTVPGIGIGLRRMVFTPDGHWLVTHSWSGRVDVIDAAAGKHSRTLTSEGQLVRSIELGVQARTLAAVTEDGTRLVWPLVHSPEEAIAAAKQIAPACLDINERSTFGLATRPPQWCTQLRTRGASLR